MTTYPKELKKFIENEIEEIGLSNLNRHMKIYHKTEYSQIFEITQFAPDFKLTQKCYCILNNIYEIPKCRVCDKPVKFLTFKVGFRQLCSRACLNHDNIAKQKRQETHKETCLEKYGVEHNWSIVDENGLHSIEKHNLEKHGVKNSFQVDENKETSKQTMNEKYGKDYYTQTGEFQETVKNNCLEKYGVEYYTQTAEFKEKNKETCLEKYGVSHISKLDNIKEKIKQTNLEKYGVTCTLQLDKCRENSMKTQSRLINELITSNRKFNPDYRKLAKACGIFWNLGLNETKILDQVEHDNNIELERQYAVLTYFVDGYDEKNNVCYEVDEQHHLTEAQIEKDVFRQHQIEDTLKCTFIRIPDLTH